MTVVVNLYVSFFIVLFKLYNLSSNTVTPENINLERNYANTLIFLLLSFDANLIIVKCNSEHKSD